jgi:serine/threonine protein kinase
MEYADKGNMLDHVNSKERLSENQRGRSFAQLVLILEYLHRELNGAHRDLKSENVLLDRYNTIRATTGNDDAKSSHNHG